MALELIPSSFRCDCGHESDFCEGTVRGMKDDSKKQRKPMQLIDSEDDKHLIEFAKGKATAVICPINGRCKITGWA